MRPERKIVFELRVGQPPALAVVVNDVPLVPSALLILVEDTPHHDECAVLILPFSPNLYRRAVLRQFRDLSPTFFKSRSVRTRIEWQNSHVVCTAPDQRKFTRRPAIRTIAYCRSIFLTRTEAAHRARFNQPFKIPIRPLPATEKIQAQRSILGKSMARQVRLLQQTHPRNAPRIWKLMPARFPQWMEVHLLDKQFEES